MLYTNKLKASFIAINSIKYYSIVLVKGCLKYLKFTKRFIIITNKRVETFNKYGVARVIRMEEDRG